MRHHSLTLAFLLAAPLAAQDATVTVLHGVPGLPAPVEVFANGASLFTFDYGEQRGPLQLPPATYALEVRLNGSPILSANATVAAGADYSIAAHLDAMGMPRLTVLQNSLTALTLPASRLYVRHLAQAPSVDVVLEQNGAVVATIPGLSNGQQAVADVAPGRYAARLVAGGTTAFGPVDLVVENGFGYGVFAVGNVAQPEFTLLVQRVELTARVTVVHGIPGLPAPVTVRAGGSPLFSFDFRDVRGPLVLDPGTYALDVTLNNNPVLATNAQLGRGDDVTIVAHLDGNGGNVLSAFANDVSPLQAGEARVAVRHLARAPAVDARVGNQGAVLATIPGLTNGNEAVATLPLGNFDVSLLAAGTSTVAFGPVGFRPADNFYYEFLALGDLGGTSFTVEVLHRDLTPAVPGQIATRVGGLSCGPNVTAQPASFDYGQPFELRLTNAPANAMAMVIYGDSLTAQQSLPLPLDLTPLGAAGCFQHANVLTVLATFTDAQGGLGLGYVVPRSLFGVLQPGFFQVGVLSNANALGIVTSEYLELR